MDKSAKTKLVNDIENQLDDFFGDKTQAPAAPKSNHSLEKLKSAVLSIDWEITDGCLSDLINQTDSLLPEYEDDPIILALLRMLRALGRYIRKRKAQAHQDAIRRVMSVFTSLETLLTEQNISEQQKKQLVIKEMQAFKKLKQKIEHQQAAKNLQKTDPTQKGNDVDALLEHQKFKQAMNEVEERFNMQMEKLKAQIASLQTELNTIRKR